MSYRDFTGNGVRAGSSARLNIQEKSFGHDLGGPVLSAGGCATGFDVVARRTMTLMKSTLLLALSLSLPLAGRTATLPPKREAISSEWPEFRGPSGQGISLAANVPIHWSATSNVAWKTAIPGRGWSSPVLSAGRLYVTTADSSGAAFSLRALCLDAGDGKVLWNREVIQPDSSSASAHHKKNTEASATPIVQGGKLYVHFGHMGTAALDLAGNVLWKQTDLQYSPVHGNGGSPVLVGDLLAFSCDGGDNPFIVALQADTGQVKWKVPRKTSAKKTFSFSTPLAIEVSGQRQIISPGSGFVGAFDPKDGREIWRVDYGEGYSLVPRPVYAFGMLFVTSGFDRPALYAIQPSGAKGDVTESKVVWNIKKSVPNTPSLLVAGEEIYFVSDNGIATCASAMTGEIHWSERLGGDFSASPVLAENRVYFQNETGTGFVLKPGKSFALLAKNNLGERTLASYAVADNSLFIRSENHLWRIGNP